MMIFLTVCGAIVFSLLGFGLWRQGEGWKQQGEISKDWVEAIEPKPILQGEPGFRAAVVWQKTMAVVAWFFAALCILSVIFQLLEML